MYVEEVEDIKTNYIEFILFYVEDIGDVYNVYELQCRF